MAARGGITPAELRVHFRMKVPRLRPSGMVGAVWLSNALMTARHVVLVIGEPVANFDAKVRGNFFARFLSIQRRGRGAHGYADACFFSPA